MPVVASGGHICIGKKKQGERLNNEGERKLCQGKERSGDLEEGREGKGWMEVKEGERATVKLPASAVKAVWALCSECVRTCAHWCAFAQSALTPFKVTAS